ncbi:MAG: thiamine pyrophosphate-dependent enzyme [Burkholderiales bacterium]|nr:thiamine pyrophosphate-dependent enzyme [Burkholderiales bacterium]
MPRQQKAPIQTADPSMPTRRADTLQRTGKLDLYRRMRLIRRIEELIGELVTSGDIPGAVHLCIGQEAVAAGVCAHLSDADWITSTHRGHGHFLAKNGDPRAMLAEILGRATGVCRGKGGSMHVADFARGILGANGIVGGGSASPLARRLRRSWIGRAPSQSRSSAMGPRARVSSPKCSTSRHYGGCR